MALKDLFGQLEKKIFSLSEIGEGLKTWSVKNKLFLFDKIDTEFKFLVNCTTSNNPDVRKLALGLLRERLGSLLDQEEITPLSKEIMLLINK